jgi:hypothetical protein
VILSLAALAKTVVLARLHDHPLLQPVGGSDSAYYVSLAHGVLGADPASAGHAFFVAPLYVYFLAGAIAVLRSELSVRVLQIVLGTAAVWLIHRTARDWFGERRAAGRGSRGGNRAVHVPRNPAAARRARPVPDGAGPVRGRARGDRA